MSLISTNVKIKLQKVSKEHSFIDLCCITQNNDYNLNKLFQTHFKKYYYKAGTEHKVHCLKQLSYSVTVNGQLIIYEI